MWRRLSLRCSLELTAPLSAPPFWWQCSGNCLAYPLRDLFPQEFSSGAAPQPCHLLKHDKFPVYSVPIPRYHIQEAKITVSTLPWPCRMHTGGKQSIKGKQKAPLVHRPHSGIPGKGSETLSISPASHSPEPHGFQLYLFLAQLCEVRHSSLFTSSWSARSDQQPPTASTTKQKYLCKQTNFTCPFQQGTVQLPQIILWKLSLATKLGSFLLLVIHKEIQPALMDTSVWWDMAEMAAWFLFVVLGYH